MISVDEALRKILEETIVLAAEETALLEAVERIVAKDILAREDLPSFDNSAMDGYAIKVKDLAGASKSNPAALKLKETVRAGAKAQSELREGEAIRIMTGAPMPLGGEAVVMKEHAEQVNGNGLVRIWRKVVAGENVRPRGEDIQAEQLLIKKGTLIRPYEVALLAAQGITKVPVVKQPRLGVVATGDELVGASQESLKYGQIRNSNTPAICAALKRWGALPIDFGAIGDDPRKLQEKFQQALEFADILIVSGGVSVGDFDHTKATLEAMLSQFKYPL